MVRKVSSLFESTIQTKDGENLGKVHDLYFDRTDWTIAYLVVDLDDWLFGRRVLIATSALGQSRWDYSVLPVALTKAEVKSSPEIDLSRPVTRAQESALHRYYNWPSDGSPPLSTVGPPPVRVGSPLSTSPPADIPRVVIEALEKTEASHVHSVRELMNDAVEATDGTVGHVTDLILDDEAWALRYLLVKPGNWWSDKKVLLSLDWIKQIDWSESHVYVDVTKAQVESSPAYDPSQPTQRSYERQLHAHYDRAVSW
jgi:sporulation protein YlmC with PRC-barrel domain